VAHRNPLYGTSARLSDLPDSR